MLNKKILYLTFDGLTDPLGRSQILPYIKGLSKNGFSFTIISLEKKQRFLISGQQLQQDLKELNIEWKFYFFSQSIPILSNIINQLKFKKAVKTTIKNNHFDLIHCRSYPSAFIASKAKKNYTKLLLDIRGFWVDERLDGEIWNINNFFYRMLYRNLKKKEIEIFRKADHIISLTEKGKEIILSYQKKYALKAKVSVIPCCTDTELFDSSKIDSKLIEEYKQKINLPSFKPIISYLGSLGTWYLPEEMLRLFKEIKSKYPQAIFLFITPDNPSNIKNLAQKYQINLDSLIFYSAQRNEIPILLSLSDISVFFIKPTFSKKASSPTKQGEILSMGKPIICNSGIGDTDQIISSNQVGYIIPDFSDESFEKIVEKFDQIFTESPQKFRNVAIKYFSLESGIHKYQSIYQQLEL